MVGHFLRRYQIDRVLHVSNELAQPWKILESTCSEDSARVRLDDPSHLARNRNFSLFLDVKSRFELIEYPKTVIDTDQPLETASGKRWHLCSDCGGRVV